MKKIILCLLALILVACGSTADSNDNGKLTVVTTTGQLRDTVAEIAGDTINVEGLLGTGVDPHLYVPTEGDVTKLSDADVIIYNGLFLEAQMERVMEQLAQQGKIMLAVGDNLPEDRLIAAEEKAFDPHVWNDPLLWNEAVVLIRDTLMEADPDNASQYEQNAEQYMTQVTETHAYITEQLATIPENQRVLITAHDAFGYFGRTYNLEVLGLQGLSTESEAGTADVRDLADFIVNNQVPAIFVETSVPPSTIEALQEAVRDQGFDVQIGGELFSDSLGEAGHPAESYIGMLRYNADTIAQALGE